MEIRNLKFQISNRAARGFTLLEMMVVVAVIIILIGIGLTVGNAVIRSAEMKLTQTVLGNLDNIATEFKVTTGQDVNHLFDALTNPAGRTIIRPYDWGQPRQQNFPAGSMLQTLGLKDQDNNGVDNRDDIIQLSGARFLWVTLRVEGLKKLYGSFPQTQLADKAGHGGMPSGANGTPDGFVDALDGWGNPVIYVAYVRIEPGSTGWGMAADDFLPMKESPYFASAGPDGQWGDVRPAALQADRDAAADNVYSFDIVQK